MYKNIFKSQNYCRETKVEVIWLKNEGFMTSAKVVLLPNEGFETKAIVVLLKNEGFVTSGGVGWVGERGFWSFSFSVEVLMGGCGGFFIFEITEKTYTIKIWSMYI